MCSAKILWEIKTKAKPKRKLIEIVMLIFTWMGSQQMAKTKTTTTTILVTRRFPFLFCQFTIPFRSIPLRCLQSHCTSKHTINVFKNAQIVWTTSTRMFGFCVCWIDGYYISRGSNIIFDAAFLIHCQNISFD